MPIRFRMHDSPSVADVLEGINIGKIWYAIPPGNVGLPELTYDIPKDRVQSTITAGVAALIAGQNDRLIVCANSDHDTDEWGEAATITLNKHSCKIIGLNRPKIGGSYDLFTLTSADNCVIAGMWMSPASGKSGVLVDASDFVDIRDNVIVHEATAAGSYCLELANTTAANYLRILNNHLIGGLNGIFFEICNDMIIQDNKFVQTAAASTIGIEETLTDGTALRNIIYRNILVGHATTTTGIKLTNDTAYSHFIMENQILGHATPITQDKYDEGVGPNYIYSATAVAATVDPTA